MCLAELGPTEEVKTSWWQRCRIFSQTLRRLCGITFLGRQLPIKSLNSGGKDFVRDMENTSNQLLTQLHEVGTMMKWIRLVGIYYAAAYFYFKWAYFRFYFRVIMAAVFIPLIQKELDIFRTEWNTHRIRRQNIYRPCGIPNFLYAFPEQNGKLVFW
jgi:hypothetical protein